MKSRSLMMISVMLCSFGLVSCGKTSETEKEYLESLATEVTEKYLNGDSEISEQSNIDSDSDEGDTINQIRDNTGTEQETESEEVDAIKIELNNLLEMQNDVEKIEYTLTDVVFQDEVYSNSDNMYATYFPDIEGESYVVAKISVRNIGSDLTGYWIFDDIQVTFNNEYNYGMQQLDLESSVMSQYWTCQPLKITDIYWVQSVPDEVKEMGCNITFTVGDASYKY